MAPKLQFTLNKGYKYSREKMSLALKMCLKYVKNDNVINVLVCEYGNQIDEQCPKN